MLSIDKYRFNDIQIISLISVLIFLSSFSGTILLASERGFVNTEYCLRNWTNRDGLPQNTVMTIIQSMEGYIWFGTEEGLVRFDGLKFSCFTGESIGINHNLYVTALFEIKKGIILIGTRHDGLLLFTNDKLKRLKLPKSRDKNISITGILKANDGSIYIASYNSLYILENNEFSLLNDNSIFNKIYINVIYQDTDDTLWIGTYGSGLYKLKNGKITHYTTDHGLPDNIIFSIADIKDIGLLVGTNQGLSIFKDSHFSCICKESALISRSIFAIRESKDNTILIGTSKGLGFIKKDVHLVINRIEELSEVIIRSIFQDKDENIWIGTYGQGLACLNKSRFSNFTIKNGLKDKNVNTVFEDRSGRIWIGTKVEGITIIDSDKILSLTKDQGLASNYIISFYEDSDCNIWIGTFNGLSKYHNGKLVTYLLKDNFIRSITKDSSGTLWLATLNGLYYFEDDKFSRFKDENIPMIAQSICLYNDGKGIWVGTADAKIYYILDKKIKYYYTAKNGLLDENVKTLLKDDEGYLWIGTSGGLSRFKDGKFVNFTRKDGLFDNLIYVILEDDYGYLWMSCNKGVFKIKRDDLNNYAAGRLDHLTSIPYNISDGMASSECNGGSSPAGIKDSKGRLWFSTTEGATFVDPKNITDDEKQIPVIIEDVIVDNQSYHPGSYIEFPRGSKSLEFHYTGISFSGADKIQFKYKLDNFDNDWIDAGNRRAAFYTNLKPGIYNFKVIASVSGNSSNINSASFEFYLKPYFYETIIFYLLASVSFLGIISILYSFRIYRLRRLKENLAATVNERTSELKELNIKLARANKALADLASKDGLTGIYNRRYFAKLFAREWKRSLRERSVLSLIMVDIDFFKPYNDEYGHQAGDNCLKKVVKILIKYSRRETDIIARYGGEEFVIILPATDLKGAILVAEKIRDGVIGLKIKHRTSRINDYVTISAGVATVVPEIATDQMQLISAADKALYKAKREGRNRIEIYNLSDEINNRFVFEKSDA